MIFPTPKETYGEEDPRLLLILEELTSLHRVSAISANLRAIIDAFPTNIDAFSENKLPSLRR